MIEIHKRAINGCVAIGAFFFLGSTVFANTYSVIQTPPAAAIASIANEEMLHQLVLANLIGSNCNGSGLTKGDAGLLGGTAQTVAEHIEVGGDQYFSEYIRPAMMKMMVPDSCEKYSGDARESVEILKRIGGVVVDD